MILNFDVRARFIAPDENPEFKGTTKVPIVSFGNRDKTPSNSRTAPGP
jgi:hypothetical protein